MYPTQTCGQALAWGTAARIQTALFGAPSLADMDRSLVGAGKNAFHALASYRVKYRCHVRAASHR